MARMNAPTLFRDLRRAATLLSGSPKGWLIAATVGSVVLAVLDMLGVAAMLPLMQVLTGSSTTEGFAGVISRGIGTSDVQPVLLTISGIVGVAFVLKSVATIGFRWWLFGRSNRMIAEASTEVMRRYALSGYEAHRRRRIPEIYRTMGVVPQVFGQTLFGLVGLAADLLTVLGVVIVLGVVSPAVTLFTVILFAAISWGIQAALSRQQRRVGETMAEAELEVWGALIPGIDGFRESRLASRAGAFVSRFENAKQAQAKATRIAQLMSELPKSVFEVAFVLAIAGVAVILFAANPIAIALSILAVFAGAATRVLPTINRIVATLGIVRSSHAAVNVLMNAMDDLGDGVLHDEQPSNTVRYSGDIEIDNVTFRFSDSSIPILQDLSLRIPEGKITGLVGSSGAGKSTLLDLVLGLLVPSAGSVSCGGRSIHQDLASWYSTIGVVPQDIYLLDDSLARNIAYGIAEAEIDQERVLEVLRLARLDALVGSLPDGLDTRLGERGVRLSGGQRQRVGIARALYGRPRILVLDEATSALDNSTELEISETVASLQGDMTIIIVAHRLSTVRNADNIVFMSDGAVRSQGTFDEVRRDNVDFARLVDLGSLLDRKTEI